jgi:hypothetical protein
MNIKSLKPTTVVNNLIVNRPMIIHVIPEFETTVVKTIKNSGLNINSAHGIVISTSPIKIAGKTVNPKTYHTSAVKNTPVKIYTSTRFKLPETKYIIIDHTVLTKRIFEVSQHLNKRQAALYLFETLKAQFQSIKKQFPSIEQTLLFTLSKSSDGLFDLLDIAKRLDSVSINIFDKYMLASVIAGENSATILPFASFSQKGEPQILKPGISKIRKLLSNIEPQQIEIEKSSKETPLSTAVTPAISSTIKKVENSQEFKSSAEINKKQLSAILRKYKIRDPGIVNNVKHAIDSYVAVNPQNINHDELEQIILKAIHYSVFNDQEVKQEYLDDPAKLFAKLSEVNTYSVDINYPTPRNAQAIDPSKIIKFNKVTGPIRHEFEYSDNIKENVKELFKSLEDKKKPLKIKSIKSEYKDNNMDRYLEFTITVQNMVGGRKDAYDLKVRVPALINQKYFKLNGKEYISSSQQFLNPVTKDKNNEAKFLSHYAMTTLKINNVRFNVTQIQELIDYVSRKYNSLITSTNDKGAVTFSNNMVIDINSKTPYKKDDSKIELVNGKYSLIKDDQEIKTVNKNEFLFEQLFSLLKNENPEETLGSSKKSFPYIEIYLIGFKLPLILLLWQQYGLIEALTRFGIDYDIGEKDKGKSHVSLSLKDKKNLYVYPETPKQELFVNGLMTIPRSRSRFGVDDLSDTESVGDYLNEKYGTRATVNIELFSENMVDPITKGLLEFQDHPTNPLEVVAGPLLDKLFNDEPSHPADLKNVRVRQSEIMMHILYNELQMAYNKYKNDLDYGDEDAHIYLMENYVIDNLLGRHAHSGSDGGSTIEYVESFSPVDELVKAAKVVKTGKGGIPNKRAFRKEQRNIHPSYIGNISSHSTSEYAQVGAINHHTLGVMLSNRYGTYSGATEGADPDNYSSLNLDEALIPFVNQMNSDRLVMARTHMTQKVPILDDEPPIVQTGAEYITAQLASTKFVHKAKHNGKIIDAKENEFIKVQYDNGDIDILDTMPRYSTTKRNSTIQVSLNTLKKNDKFKKDQLLAWSKQFNGDMMTGGRNTIMAVMNYIGKSYEDGYCVSKDMTDNFVTESIIKIPIIIPPNAKVLDMINKETDTVNGDSLIEFQYVNTIDEYMNTYDIEDEDFAEDAAAIIEKGVGQTIKRISPGGKIVDIRIKINGTKDVDPFIISRHKKIASDIKATQRHLTANAKNQKEKLTDNIDLTQLKTGSHKFRGQLFEGALIEFYIRSPKKLQTGDKLSNRYGAKGVVTAVFEEECKGEDSGPIDIFLAPTGVLGRKNTSILKELYIGKIFWNLRKIAAKRAGRNLATTKKLILSIYEILDPTKDKRQLNAVTEKFETIQDHKLKTQLVEEKFQLNYLVPPFNTPSFDMIKEAADTLKIELDERVYIPSTGTWTKEKVPVGLHYMSAMEQTAQDLNKSSYTGMCINNFVNSEKL